MIPTGGLLNVIFRTTDIARRAVPLPGADPGVEIGGGHTASAEREPIMGVWGLCPQRGPGAEPLVRGSRGQSPPS